MAAAPPIEPEALHPTPTPGMDADAVCRAAAPGLYVLAGPNNAGKTRLLRSLIAARYSAAITLNAWRPGGPRLFENASLRDEVWPKAGPIEVEWPRNIPAPTEGFNYASV